MSESNLPDPVERTEDVSIQLHGNTNRGDGARGRAEIRIGHSRGPMPRYEGPGWEPAARLHHETQATQLFEALHHALPGGTLDQLLVALMRHKACLFVVGDSRRTKVDPDGVMQTTFPQTVRDAYSVAVAVLRDIATAASVRDAAVERAHDADGEDERMACSAAAVDASKDLDAVLERGRELLLEIDSA